jgi:hypothetical protein
MKKRNLLIFALLPFTLLSCGESLSSSNDISSSTKTTQPAKESSTPISSKGKEISTSSTPVENVNFTKLKKSLRYMSLQDKIMFSSNNGTFQLGGNGTVTKTEVDDESSTTGDDTSSGGQEITTTTVTPFDVNATLSNMSIDLAFSGLRKNNFNQTAGSLSVTNDLALKYTVGNGDDTKSQDITKQDVGIDTYLKQNYIYIDYDNKNLQDIVSTLMTDFLGKDYSAAFRIAKYFKYSPESFENVSAPVNNASQADINSFVDSFEDMYSSLGEDNTLITFRSDEDYTYMNVSINTLMLRMLPSIAKSYMLAKLDSSSEDYDSQVKKVNTTYNALKSLADATTVKSMEFTIAYSESGIKSISQDIDLTIKNFNTADTSTIVEEGGMDANIQMKIDQMDIKNTFVSNVEYGDSVKVNSPSSGHIYVDTSTLIK